jgi:hypothetical protein
MGKNVHKPVHLEYKHCQSWMQQTQREMIHINVIHVLWNTLTIQYLIQLTINADICNASPTSFGPYGPFSGNTCKRNVAQDVYIRSLNTVFSNKMLLKMSIIGYAG